MKPDVELMAHAVDQELSITYRGKTWNLTAYPLEDFGTWEATAHEQGTTTPALPAAEWGAPGLFRDPWTALSILADAIIRKEGIDG